MRAIDMAKDEKTKKIIRMAKSVMELMITLPEKRREYYVEGEYLRLGLWLFIKCNIHILNKRIIRTNLVNNNLLTIVLNIF